MSKKEKVQLKGEVTIKEKKNSFFKESLSTIGPDLWDQIALPLIKKGVSTVLKTAIDWLLNGTGSSPNVNDSYSRPYNYVSYDRYYTRFDSRSSEREKDIVREHRSSEFLNIRKIIFESKEDAEKVLDTMINIIDEFGFASIADLYDIIEKSCPYTGEDYGWYNLKVAKVFRVAEGWILDLPKMKKRK